jgi:putative hemolysin
LRASRLCEGNLDSEDELMKRHAIFIAVVGIVAALLLTHGCTKRESSGEETLSYNTPDEAVGALVAALEKHDVQELGRVLGPGTEKLVSSGDDVADRAAREAFLTRYREQHLFVAGSPGDVVLQVGADNWPLPIPLVREQGRWRFDGEAGADELLARRIGANELRTIDVMLSYVGAQLEYASIGHDGAAAGIYARRLRSEPGKHDGLYWETAADEAQSPAGPLLAAAADEGYGQASGAPYHGYMFRTLLAQGPEANGGAREYVVGGKLTGGFALLAYPADYGASGVMTFVVNQDGVVWQRDLGEKTADLASSMQQFNPDATWTPIAPESLEAGESAKRADPAARNCGWQGGTLVTERDPAGREYGVCVFADNRQCEAWALLRSECPTGGVRVFESMTAAARFCAITGGRYTMIDQEGAAGERGACAFPGGKKCDAVARYRRTCSARDTAGCDA